MSPDLLPPIASLRRITQSLAMLDAILCPEWEYRYYSFNSQWAPAEEMASMRDGCGDDWFLLFNEHGAALKGFVHELAQGSALPDEIQRQVPGSFSSFLGEAAFSMQHATFCYWCAAGSSTWHKVSGFDGDDGAQDMLDQLISGPSGYQAWAQAYYEVPVPLDAVTAIFSHAPITEALVQALNPQAEMDGVLADAQEIGYPHGTTL